MYLYVPGCGEVPAGAQTRVSMLHHLVTQELHGNHLSLLVSLELS